MNIFGVKIGVFRDGGPGSPVSHYGIESKRFGSIMLLRFQRGVRTAYHSHAFNCWSFVLAGILIERFWGGHVEVYRPGSIIHTPHYRVHKAYALPGKKDVWVLTVRGPWRQTWVEGEQLSDGNVLATVLGNGRTVQEVSVINCAQFNTVLQRVHGTVE